MLTPAASPAGAGAAAAAADRAGWIDGLRALCALTVVLWHGIAGIAGMPREVVERSALAANLAVEMFFVISGYLITASLLRRALPGGGLAAYRRFLIARSVRILPTACAGLAAFYAVAAWLGPPFGAGDCLVYATFQSHWYEASHGGGSVVGPGQYWSLSIEEHFYLLWPLLLALGGGLCARPWARLGAAMALGLATRALLLALGWDPFYFFLARLDGLAAGAVLALAGIERVAGALRARHLLLALAAILAGAVGWLLYSGAAERAIQPGQVSARRGGLPYAVPGGPHRPVARGPRLRQADRGGQALVCVLRQPRPVHPARRRRDARPGGRSRAVRRRRGLHHHLPRGDRPAVAAAVPGGGGADHALGAALALSASPSAGCGQARCGRSVRRLYLRCRRLAGRRAAAGERAMPPRSAGTISPSSDDQRPPPRGSPMTPASIVRPAIARAAALLMAGAVALLLPASELTVVADHADGLYQIGEVVRWTVTATGTAAADLPYAVKAGGCRRSPRAR